MKQSDESVPTLVPWPTPLSRSLRAKFFITGVLLPGSNVIAGLTGMRAGVNTPWQSGDLYPFATVLLEGPCLAFFAPLILFSMVCLSIWTFRPASSERLWIRIGIFSGVILALQFLILVLATSHVVTLIGAVIAGPCLALVVYLISQASRRVRQFTILHLFFFITGCSLVFASGVLISSSTNIEIGELFGSILVALFVAAPTLNLFTYLRVSYAIIDERKLRLLGKSNLIGYFSWVVTWGTCWKFAVNQMMFEYANLSTTDPNCFVSGAAANGHQRFVGAQFIHTSLESSAPKIAVNQQMRRLKFLEFALAAASPVIHKFVRRIYNRLGPSLATFCKHNIWIADVTFLCLKPIEFASLFLCLLTGIRMDRVTQLYRPR